MITAIEARKLAGPTPQERNRAVIGVMKECNTHFGVE